VGSRNRKEAVGVTQDLLARLPDLERQAEEYERKARALRQVVQGMRELNGDLSLLFPDTAIITPAVATADDPGPRGRDALRTIVAERPGVWTLTDLIAEMQQRGWFTSRKAVDVAVKRLCRSGEARRIGMGRYMFPADGGEEGTIESHLSDVAMITSE
jgi:hypothetical protein